MPETADHAINANVGYEPSDVDMRSIVWFGVGLFAFVAISSVLMAWLFHWFADLERQQYKPLPKLAKQERLVFPKDLNRVPGPLLQESEEADLAKMREREKALLNSKENGRVPIDVALERMADPKFAAEHGIRVRPNPPKGQGKHP